MDPCTGQHGVIVALFLTLNFGLWLCQEAEVFFTPVNLKILSDSPHQRLLVEWSVSKEPHKSDTNIKFHIQVARSEKMNIIANKYITSNFSRSPVPFGWSWESQLPLECDSHSVRLRSAVVGNDPKADMNWSEWSEWTTHDGENIGRKDTKVYPRERVVPEGSNVTFCCLPGQDQTIQEMIYGPEKMERCLDMGTDVYVTSRNNVSMTRSDGANVVCLVDKDDGVPPGTVLIVSRLPDEPKDFSCKTQDLRLLRCTWDPGHGYNFYNHLSVRYVLHEWSSRKNISCERDHCDRWPIQMDQQMYNFSLTATNPIGERRINSIVYLTESVLLLAPHKLSAESVNASAITLTWSLRADYTSLLVRCQVDLQRNPGSEVNMTSRGKQSTGIYNVRLGGLEPYTLYNLTVRCMAVSSLAGWSNWSHLLVTTLEDAPAGTLDVWRHIEESDGEQRIVTLYWKPSSLFRTNGNLSHYNIKFWALEGGPVGSENISSSVNSSRISMGIRAYSISVTAHNKAGGSLPAELRIPATAAPGTEQITAKRTYGKDGGIYITWSQKANAHGYVVEWCAAPGSPHCDLQWKKYNSSVRSDVIKSRVFRPEVRYDFRIYGSMKDGERLLEKMVGYTQEGVCSMKPNVRINELRPRSVSLDWWPYSTDKCLKGFLTGYNIYVKDTEGDCKLSKSDRHIQQDGIILCRFHIGNPNKTQITINELKPNGEYEVAVVALTGGGETPKEYIKARIPTDDAAALLSIIVPIIMVSVLALVLLFLGCWKRTWLKRMCLPDIPDPNKSKIFSFNRLEGSLNRTILPTLNCEPQMVDIVSFHEHGQAKTLREVNDSPEHQLHKTDSRIRIEVEDYFSKGYVPFDNEKSMYLSMDDPTYKLQDLPHQAFFNQTYTYTSNCISDNVPGYKPQTDIAQLHCPPYDVPKSRLDDDDTAICLKSPGYYSEPMSPTSVDSTAFMLVN
ncbi:oncostatin-M-specific receptor subunit beta isoform X2 [Eleutherodactylus coqui]|uniref:oncostatin-M-specific receptor subunit beta isoform X2 n=1 Tax=Eleutherodactylus coqui TaxID=57060 RepID=UPI003462EFE5